jgi:putative membrane protein
VISVSALPAVNASLNATSAVLLTAGYVAIRRRNVAVHRACMIAAFATSIVFLGCYVVYHLHAGTTRFPGTGLARTIYFTILGTHTPLAATVPFLAIVTLSRALAARFDSHRRIARWTWPIWMYVSVTGVLVYVMLYQLYPPPGGPLG